MYIVLFCRLGTFQHVFKRFIDFYGYRRKKKKNLLSFFPSDPTHPFSNFFRITIISATFFYLLRVVVVVVYNNNTKLFCYWFFVKNHPVRWSAFRDTGRKFAIPPTLVTDPSVIVTLIISKARTTRSSEILSFNEISNELKRRKRQYRQ